MKITRRFSRRTLLRLTAASGVAAAARGKTTRGADKKPTGRPGSPASRAIRLIADKIVEWQTPSGDLDSRRCPFGGGGHLSYPFLGAGMYRAYKATGVEAYKAAAAGCATFYLSIMSPVWHTAHFGLALRALQVLKLCRPGWTQWNAKATALVDWMLPWRWDEPTYFRMGYGAGGMADAANCTDNAHAGAGLMAYYQMSENPKSLKSRVPDVPAGINITRVNAEAIKATRVLALEMAEGLARCYLTEMKPGTYQGWWSSKLGTWAIAPNSAIRFEHFRDSNKEKPNTVKCCETGWGYASIESIDYLTQLSAATSKEDLKAAIPGKCATSMKWQFDGCQFDDGACGIIGRDDKWLGMTAGAVLSYVRTKAAGFLSDRDVAQYRPKAQAALDWMLRRVTPETLDSRDSGYVKVTGRSTPNPRDFFGWHLGWTLEALVRADEI